MTELLIIIIGVVTLVITCWVLYESIRARKTGDAQLKLATEPDFELFISMPNRDPIRMNCINRGVPVTDFKISLGIKQLHIFVESGNGHENHSYNIDLPRVFIQDESILLLKITYIDKIKRMRECYYVYNVKSKEIKLKS